MYWFRSWIRNEETGSRILRTFLNAARACSSKKSTEEFYEFFLTRLKFSSLVIYTAVRESGKDSQWWTHSEGKLGSRNRSQRARTDNRMFKQARPSEACSQRLRSSSRATRTRVDVTAKDVADFSEKLSRPVPPGRGLRAGSTLVERWFSAGDSKKWGLCGWYWSSPGSSSWSSGTACVTLMTPTSASLARDRRRSCPDGGVSLFQWAAHSW